MRYQIKGDPPLITTVADEYVLLHQEVCYTLNETMHAILIGIQEGKTEEVLLKELVTTYGVSHTNLVEDMKDALSQLEALGIVEKL